MMIDDTQDSVEAKYPSSLSEEVLQITQYRTYRHAALDWAKKLRFLAWDDTSSTPDDLPRRQECSHCKKKPRHPSSVYEYFDGETLHFCDKPFHNQHKITEEDWRRHPQRFICDLCQCNILRGLRYHCGECDSGNYDACEECIASGKHCLDIEHELEKIPVFQFGDCVHVNARSCNDCQDVSVFPDREVTNFRIVQPGDGQESSCDHFIAVSYCWPSPQYDSNGNMVQHQGQYTVKDQHGRVRKNRAPEDVITRAVRFAAQNGIRLIWIDQECIDQDNMADKELGIQAMDKVYQRAFLSIGLLRTRIESQRTLDALQYLLAESGESTTEVVKKDVPTAELVDIIISFFEPILADPWHSRAWILQEGFSAGARMCLLLERSPDIVLKNLRGVSLVLSKSEIVIHFDMFLFLLEYAQEYLIRSLLTLPATNLLSQRRLSLLRSFKHFVPGDERSIDIKWTHQIGKTKARRSCNAAVAMSYLRTRQNTHVPDRLAILANLCNYDLRLNTVETEKNHRYLSICVLALALINGDFSLLYPDVYDSNGPAIDLVEQNIKFSWMKTNGMQLQNLDLRSINSPTHYFHHFPHPNTISEGGLLVPGYLWKIDRRIHLPDFPKGSGQRDWFRARHAVHIYHVLRSPFYNAKSWMLFSASPIFQDLDKEKRVEYLESISKSDGMTEEELEAWAVEYRLKILKQWQPAAEQQFQMLVSYFLIRALYLLRDQNELEVADAMWQSIRKDNWDAKLSIAANQARGWFNSVADFPPYKPNGKLGLNLDVITEMLQLDSSRDGAYQQCWVIDSLFRDGYLSVGKFVRVSHDDVFAMHPEWAADQNEELPKDLDMDVPLDATDTQTDLTSTHSPPTTFSDAAFPLSPEIPLPAVAEIPQQAKEPFNLAAHADTQLFKQLIQSTFISLVEDLPPQHFQNRTPFPKDAYTVEQKQMIFSAAMLYSGMETDWRGNGDGKLRNMRAIFDVNSLHGKRVAEKKSERPKEGKDRGEEVSEDGNMIWVVTPYDQRTERLPHTEARTMSMSWVVEPTGECPDDSSGPREVFTTQGMVKGMWKLMDQPLTHYSLV